MFTVRLCSEEILKEPYDASSELWERLGKRHFYLQAQVHTVGVTMLVPDLEISWSTSAFPKIGATRLTIIVAS